MIHEQLFGYRLLTERTFDLQSFTLVMASAQVVETPVNTNNSPSQGYTTNPDNHSNHNIDSPGFKPFTVIFALCLLPGKDVSPSLRIAEIGSRLLNMEERRRHYRWQQMIRI